MKLHNLKQGTPEWFEVRKGKLTASNAQAIATGGKGLETLVYEILAEKYSSAEPINYTNADMERGHKLEEQARQMYELENGLKIIQVGFAELDEFTGASPDGLIGEDGLIEIKCKKDSVYIRALIEGGIDSKYEWQMQMQMLVTDRKWVDFVDYNPNFTKSMNITRIVADPKKQEKLREGIEKGKTLLIEKDKLYKQFIN